jgi:DNA modification methylase
MSVRIINSDWISGLKTLPDQSVHCVVTSPPYWRLRDYSACSCIQIRPREQSGIALVPRGEHLPTTREPSEVHAKPEPNPNCPKCHGMGKNEAVNRAQLGQEKTLADYIEKLVAGFREVRRVLRDDGLCIINLGDGHASAAKKWGGSQGNLPCKQNTNRGSRHAAKVEMPEEIGYKDLLLIPFRLALALQSDRWVLRSVIPWIAPNKMPESVEDRPTCQIEYFLMLTKSERYYWDRCAVMKECAAATLPEIEPDYLGAGVKDYAGAGAQDPSDSKRRMVEALRRNGGQANRRTTDWLIESWRGLIHDGTGNPLAILVNTAGSKTKHTATFPPKLIEPFIRAGCPSGGTVLDPFAGSFTTCQVAVENGRDAIGIELSPEYCQLGRERLGLFAPQPVA